MSKQESSAWIYLDDQIPDDVRDYIVAGPTQDHKRDLEDWGADWDRKEMRWILKNTSPSCPDYQALEDLGLMLLPIQESIEEKTLQEQLKK